MIKRIIITIILTVCLCVGTLWMNQRKAEAVLPFIGYVAIAALIHFAVGAYIYMNSGGDTEVNEITAIDQATGQITIDTASTSLNFGIISGNGKSAYPKSIIASTYPTVTDWIGWSAYPKVTHTLQDALNEGCFNHVDNPKFCAYSELDLNNWKVDRWGQATNGPIFLNGDPDNDTLTYNPSVGLGGSYEGSIDGNEVAVYDFIEDVPLLPNCFDGIQNQDETGIDCGGVCEINFGFVCPTPLETCFDGIMNQDETGIDYGGVCGIGGDPPPAGPEPTNFIDVNVDGIDDLSGYDSSGNVPIGAPGAGDSSTYDTSLPGEISEVGETNWSGLITGYLSTNPLVLLATGSSINLSGEECTLTANVFGTDIVIDFCPLEGMIDLIGTFVLGLMAIRSVFIAMGI